MTKTELLQEKQQLEYSLADAINRLDISTDAAYKRCVSNEMAHQNTRLFQVNDLIKQFENFETRGTYAYWD